MPSGFFFPLLVGLFLVLVGLVGLVDSYKINEMFRFVFCNSDANDLFY